MSDIMFNQLLDNVDLISFEQCLELLSKVTKRLKNVEESTKPVRRELGGLKGQIKMSDDFDEPLECFKEYM